jgi:hypothetical protein
MASETIESSSPFVGGSKLIQAEILKRFLVYGVRVIKYNYEGLIGVVMQAYLTREVLYYKT